MLSIRARLSHRLGDDLFRQVAAKGSVALLVRVLGALLSFLMFVAIARAMNAAEFGRFALGFSLAAFLAIVVSAGQPTLALRYIPNYLDAKDHSLGRGLAIYGYSTVAMFSAASALLLTLVWFLVASDEDFLLAAAFLMAALAMADHQSSSLRGNGLVASALLPKEVLWRVLVITFTVPFTGALDIPLARTSLTAESGILIAAASLGLVLVVQHIARRETLLLTTRSIRPAYDLKPWTLASVGLWGVAVLQSGSQHANLAVAGLVLAPAETGGLFAAMRVAMLVNFFLLAANLVAAPLISRLWAAGRVDELQRTCAVVTLLASIPTLLAGLACAVFGAAILEAFGEGFGDYYPSLLILAGSQVVNCLCGQTGILMTMTGNQARMLRFVAVSNAFPLITIPLLAPSLGVTWAAFAIAVGLVLWNLLVAFWARRTLGIDTTILAVRYLGHRENAN